MVLLLGLVLKKNASFVEPVRNLDVKCEVHVFDCTSTSRNIVLCDKEQVTNNKSL